MPSRSLSRSASPEPSKPKSSKRNRSRERSRERSHKNALPSGVEPISEDDYFLKSAEFSRWLRIEKGKYFNELRTDKSRSYFRKFVKAWNRGKLSDELYTPIESTSVPSSHQTAYKWSFATNRSRINDAELQRVREEVGGDTYGPSVAAASKRSGRVQGPTLPSPADLQLAREDAASLSNANHRIKRKRENNEDRERIEEMVGPKDVGREGMLEKKRAKKEGDKTYRDSKEDGGLEVSEDVLFGGGSSFKERLAQRDAARARFEAKKRLNQDSRAQERNERAEQIKEKEKKTMEMFKQMAKERFG
ncbi:hypothetical protein BU17DRAFT_93227 [Hysterangium stoloniferum]|nr:hypothetical protein BU17DRAFT_93227 [Hysterangium stoloniferum]